MRLSPYAPPLLRPPSGVVPEGRTRIWRWWGKLRVCVYLCAPLHGSDTGAWGDVNCGELGSPTRAGRPSKSGFSRELFLVQVHMQYMLSENVACLQSHQIYLTRRSLWSTSHSPIRRKSMNTNRANCGEAVEADVPRKTFSKVLNKTYG